MRPLHELEPGTVAEASARVQAPIEGFEAVFSTCSGARSSTDCCRRWAASRLIDGPIFGGPVSLSGVLRIGAEPMEARDVNRARARSVPQSSARTPSGAPGLPLGRRKMASGTCTLSTLGFERSESMQPANRADSGRNEPRFAPWRAQLRMAGAGDGQQRAPGRA